MKQPRQGDEDDHERRLGEHFDLAARPRDGEPIDGSRYSQGSKQHPGVEIHGVTFSHSRGCGATRLAGAARRFDPAPGGAAAYSGVMALEISTHTVTDQDTAAELGSGDLPVLATPRLINWLERLTQATAKVTIPEGQTTVGTLVKVEHLKATPVGHKVRCECSRAVSDGRRLIFHVAAFDEEDQAIAAGEIHRRVVDPDRFMARFTAQ